MSLTLTKADGTLKASRNSLVECESGIFLEHFFTAFNVQNHCDKKLVCVL